jgi:hypothetical protein
MIEIRRLFFSVRRVTKPFVFGTVALLGLSVLVTSPAFSSIGTSVRAYNVNFEDFTCDELPNGKSVSEIFNDLQEKLAACKLTKLSEVIIKISCGDDKLLFTTTKEGCEYALRVRAIKDIGRSRNPIKQTTSRPRARPSAVRYSHTERPL